MLGGSRLAYRWACYEAHAHRCAVAEGFIPTEDALEKMWYALTYPHEGTQPLVEYHLNGSGCGHAYTFEGEDVCEVSMRCSPAMVLSTTLHELCHHAVGLKHDHDESFNQVLSLAASTLWGVNLFGTPFTGMHRSHLLDIKLIARQLAGKLLYKEDLSS